MSLTLGSGPFARQHRNAFNFDTSVLQTHTLFIEDVPWRIRATLGGSTVADSRNVKRLHETAHMPVYYFPLDDLDQTLLQPTDHTTHCPFKGDAAYWSITVGDRTAENAVWGYPEPLDSSPLPSNYVAFDSNAMDAFFEEDDQVFAHPRDPYHRVDVRESSQHVKVTVNGHLIADTTRPKILGETSLPVRYYIPPDDVRTDLLVDSDTTSQCPYKGVASYRSANIDGEIISDVAWTYPEPFPEAARVIDHFCFLGNAVTTDVTPGS